MKNIPSYLKMDGDSVLFDNEVGEMIYYIPEVFFERKFASILGSSYVLTGIFNYTITKDNEGKSNFGLKTFYFPTEFYCTPYKVDKLKSIRLTKNTEPADYRALRFKRGDKVVNNIFCEQNVSNADKLVAMYMTGKLPTTIDYRYAYKFYEDNMNLNGNSYGLNAQLFGIMEAESCRSKDDLKMLFRHTDMKDITNYQYIPTKLMPRFISPFANITSENIDESIVAATLNDKAKYSPLEKIMM